MIKKVRQTGTRETDHRTPPVGVADTGVAEIGVAEGRRTRAVARTTVNGDERLDANAHRTKANATNHFGADGDEQYGGGSRAPRKASTGKKTS